MDNVKEYRLDNVREYRLKLITLYSSLDIFLDANPDILITIDNTDNLYSYSNKLKLFDALQMLESKYSSFSLIDLKIRCLHYAIEQYEIIEKFIIDNDHSRSFSRSPLYNILHIDKANDIQATLHAMIQFLILPEDLHCIPAYLLGSIGEKGLYKVEE